MNVLRRSLFASVFASTLLFSSVPAQTLMGTPNVGFRFDLITLGNDELDDLMGTIYGGSVEATFVINSQIDLNVLGSYVESEGSRDLVKIDYKDKTLGGNLVFHFEPKGSITPYALAGLHYVASDIIAKRDGVRIASEDSDVGMEVGGGVEMLPVRNVVLNLKLSYVTDDEADGIVAEGRAGYWINEKALAFLSASNNFESDDQMASLGLLIRR